MITPRSARRVRREEGASAEVDHCFVLFYIIFVFYCMTVSLPVAERQTHAHVWTKKYDASVGGEGRQGELVALAGLEIWLVICSLSVLQQRLNFVHVRDFVFLQVALTAQLGLDAAAYVTKGKSHTPTEQGCHAARGTHVLVQRWAEE